MNARSSHWHLPAAKKNAQMLNERRRCQVVRVHVWSRRNRERRAFVLNVARHRALLKKDSLYHKNNIITMINVWVFVINPPQENNTNLNENAGRRRQKVVDAMKTILAERHRTAACTRERRLNVVMQFVELLGKPLALLLDLLSSSIRLAQADRRRTTQQLVLIFADNWRQLGELNVKFRQLEIVCISSNGRLAKTRRS